MSIFRSSFLSSALDEGDIEILKTYVSLNPSYYRG